MKPLQLPRTLANALLSDLQSGRGEGLVGARAGIPCAIYPASPADFPKVLDALAQRGETLFAHYAHADQALSNERPLLAPYQLRLAADIRGVIVIRAYARAATEDWQERMIELAHD
ncbi:MAG: hypothetical protein WCY67_00660 [Acidithiobacillus sp.]